MKRFGTFTAVLAILMAGFMSVCAADETCVSEAIHVSPASHSDTAASQTPEKQVQQDHCGTLCHVAPHIFQAVTPAPSTRSLGQERIISADDTIRRGLYTVLDQPPRA